MLHLSSSPLCSHLPFYPQHILKFLEIFSHTINSWAISLWAPHPQVYHRLVALSSTNVWDLRGKRPFFLPHIFLIVNHIIYFNELVSVSLFYKWGNRSNQPGKDPAHSHPVPEREKYQSFAGCVWLLWLLTSPRMTPSPYGWLEAQTTEP